MKKLSPSGSLPTYKKAMVQVVAYKRIRNVVNGALSRFNLNTTQWMILGILYESATGLRITDIARTLEVEVPLITRLSQTLVAAGLVKNTTDVADRRARPLSLTSRGEIVVTEVEDELKVKTGELEVGLSDSEINSYFRTLDTFMDNSKNRRASQA